MILDCFCCRYIPSFSYTNPVGEYPIHEHAADLGNYNSSYPIAMTAGIDDYAWNNAYPGAYSTTLTFRSEVHFTTNNP